jgi:hypothetical protein
MSRSHECHYGTWHTTLWSCTHRPSIIDLSRKIKMLWPGQEIIIQKNNYLTFRSKVKVPWRSLWYATHRLMVMHPHTKYNWPIWKDKKIMAPTRKYYLKNNYLTLRSKIKVPRRSLGYVIHHLMVMHPHTNNKWPISKDKNVMARTRNHYSKNNYLTLRSKVKVPQRSLWYRTHHLMVMHPHTNYNWPISKDKNVMARTRNYYSKNNYLTLRSKVMVPWRSLRYATHRLIVMNPHTK